MKTRFVLVTAVLFGIFAVASASVYAQHGPHAGPGAFHGFMAPGNFSNNSSAPAPRNSTSGSPDELLSRNTHLDTTLTANLQAKNLLPAGTDVKSVCSGFRNLGQCLAAIHVSHNLNLSFDCMKADMTGQSPANGVQCPAGTGESKLSLGKSIQALSPNVNSKAAARVATGQSRSEVKEAESSS